MPTTRIRGDASWKPCLHKAAMLIMDIYNYHDPELTPELRAEKAKLFDYWEPGWSEGNDAAVSPAEAEASGDSGMFCRIYYPKLEGDLGPLDVCPPVLAFRGSEMNDADIDMIAVHTEIAYAMTATGATSLAVGDMAGTVPVPVVSPTKRFRPTATRADLRAAGMVEQPLILPSADRVTISLDVGGLIPLGSVHVDWTGSSSLFFGSRGDWPTNMAQSLGHLPPQYEEAAKAARKAAQEAMDSWNGRLIIVGHSLGGGLATCAALAAKSAQPELALRCNVYNAAGLHQDTATQIARSSLSEASAAGISANLVSGDVLTSVQTPGLVPLISDVLRWGDVTLPPAIPSSAPSRGVSPGGDPGMMMSHHERAPKWRPLPVLFPLNRQTLVNGDFGTIQGIFDAASAAPEFRDFVNNLIHWLFRSLGDENGRIQGAHRLAALASAFGRVGPEFASRGGAMQAAVQGKPPLLAFPSVDLGDGGAIGSQHYVENTVEPLINGLIRDTIEFAQIMIASVDYHMWDACAYTFLLDPPD